MNNNAVFVAAIVERDTWNSSVSLVGHENTIQVASYNPRLFRRDPNMPLPSVSPAKRSTESPSKQQLANGSVDGEEDAGEEVAANVFSVVALGADDRSISIWRTIDVRPLVVVKEAFDRQILDLSWSADGKSVWACSSDGSIAVLDFSEPEPDSVTGKRRKSEMDGLTTAEETKAYISLFDFPWPPPLEANYMHAANGYPPTARAQYPVDPYAPAPHEGRGLPSSAYGGTPNLLSAYGGGGGGASMPGLVRAGYSAPAPATSLGGGVPPPPINQAQKVTLTKSGKKRIQPTFLGGGPGVVSSSGSMPPPPPPSSTMAHGRGQPGLDGGMEWTPDGGHGSSPSRHTHSQASPSRQYVSSNAGGYPGGYGYQMPAGSRLPGSGESRILAPQPNAPTPLRHSASGGYSSGVHIPGLEVPPLRTHVSIGLPGELVFEARNSDDASGERSRIS